MGCRYTLEVDEAGAGLLRVESGWVGFEHRGLQSLVPAGALCATRKGVGPGTPFFDSATPAFAQALAAIDFGPRGARRARPWSASSPKPARATRSRSGTCSRGPRAKSAAASTTGSTLSYRRRPA